MAIFFAKDALVLILYIAFLVAFRRKEIQGFRPPFLVPLLIFIWFAAEDHVSDWQVRAGYAGGFVAGAALGLYALFELLSSRRSQ